MTGLVAQADGRLRWRPGPDPERTAVIRRFRRGVTWNLVATVANQGSTFAANVVIASLLGRASFGRYAVVLSTIQLVSAFAGLSIAYTTTRYIAEFRDTDRLRAGRIYGCGQFGIAVLSAAVCAALFGCAGPIATRALNSPDLAPLLRIAALGVFFTALSGFRLGVLGGLERYRPLGICGALSGTLYFVLCVGGAAVWGVGGAVCGLVTSALAQWLILGRAVSAGLRHHGIEPSREFGAAEAGIVRRFVIPGAISSVTAAPAIWIAQAILARRASGFSEVALYTAAYNLMVVVLFLPNVANTVGMTLLNHVLGRRDAGTYERVFWMNLWTSLMITIVGAGVILALSPWLLGAYGPGFASATPVLVVLMCAAIPEVLTIALNQVLQSRERMWTAILWVNIPRDSIIVCAALALVPRYGAGGLAASYLIGRVVAVVSIAIASYRLGGPRIVATSLPTQAAA